MNDFVRQQMQRNNLDAIVRNKGFKFSPTFFPYTSGEIGPYYVNSECVMKRPEDYIVAVGCIADLVTNKMSDHLRYLISGGETRDWIFSNPVALTLKKQSIMIYKDGKIIPGDQEIKDRRFAHVADLNNEGSSPRDLWVPTIRNKGGVIEHVFFYVDRLEGGVEVMQNLGLYSDAVVPLNEDAWDYLQKGQVVSQEVYRNLKERGKTKEERDAWAVKMLRSDVGLNKLIQLIQDPKTIEKAAKILSKGYPDLDLEIRFRLEPKLENNTYITFWDRIVGQRQEEAA
ncbi:hypothetical protein J4218_06450 [Candidatus Pacearchaeota archaeon]|nr:hypothetical protein [Candidatus Pacearchaeota archaeon]